MLTEGLDFIRLYIDSLNQSLNQVGGRLTKTQKAWLLFCLTAMIFTNTVNWKAWERWSGGKYSDAALSRMLKWSHIPWSILLMASTKLILSRYNIKNGSLVIDDSDHARSKNTTKIAYTHKIKDKKTDGYFNGQNMVFLLLVTDVITFPVGVAFYMPDPTLKKWQDNDNELKKQKVQKRDRPEKPKANKKYPSKLQIAIDLLRVFFKNHPEVQIKCILADALYGSADFIKTASMMHNRVQVISQLRSDQLVRNKRGLLIEVKKHFEGQRTAKKRVFIRGGKEATVISCTQKLWVKAHNAKRTVIAIKYADEKEFRYIIASDMTWQDIHVIQAYTLRWLIEVFFQDWKSYEAWNNLAKQQGVEGSSRCVILSLLLDHSFFFHEAQTSCIENKLSLHTIGSLTEKSRLQIIFNAISSIFKSSDPNVEFQKFKDSLDLTILCNRFSEKHMSHRGFQRVFSEVA